MLSGLVLMGWALLAGRSRGTPRCPKCWYLMIGATGLRCPECGHAVVDSRQFYRTRRRWRFAALGAAIAVATPWYVMSECGWHEVSRAFLPRWETIETRQIGPYTLERAASRTDYGQMRASILFEGHVEFAITGTSIQVGAHRSDDTRNVVGIGEDITGDGVPNLILRRHAGGNHCCRTYHILSIGGWHGIDLVTSIEAGNSDAIFEDQTGDGRLECILKDWTFAYWNTCYTCSPAPEVILRYRRGAYVVAADLMAKNAPTEDELTQLARQVREDPIGSPWNSSEVSVDYWAEMLNLIYTGHEDLAWRFADEAWPKARPGKDEFLAEFRSRLAESPYWPAIRAVGMP